MLILEKAIELFGHENQMIVAVEELSELQKEITKMLRNQGNIYSLAEELADVEIMISQIKLMFPEVEKKMPLYTDIKLERLKKICEKIEMEKLINESDRG